ncbi:hypothetical protein E4T56_gene9748 [Termitomyces sp. T112]|nr:hypothetical protein E4T56_gene9748 [Termitomyces sp. T112]
MVHSLGQGIWFSHAPARLVVHPLASPEFPPQCPLNLPNHCTPSAPTPGNSDASMANPHNSLANSDVFSIAANASPGSPKPLEPSPTISDTVIHHQPITLVPLTHSGVS